MLFILHWVQIVFYELDISKISFQMFIALFKIHINHSYLSIAYYDNNILVLLDFHLNHFYDFKIFIKFIDQDDLNKSIFLRLVEF